MEVSGMVEGPVHVLMPPGFLLSHEIWKRKIVQRNGQVWYSEQAFSAKGI